jgi:hypothetical protein
LSAGQAPSGTQATRATIPRWHESDGSLRPSRPITNLFTQDAYTLYEILAPGSEQFRITFMTENNRAGATEIVNATRSGSEGTDVEVYDPRTGKPMKFTYVEEGSDHVIHATLPFPVPEGGIGRALIYKTYKDARTYQMNGKDIVWVRSLSGYRLGVVLPKGFAFLSSDVAAQLSTLPMDVSSSRSPTRAGRATGDGTRAGNDGSVQAGCVRRHVRRRRQDPVRFGRPKSGSFKVEQTYSEVPQGHNGAD